MIMVERRRRRRKRRRRRRMINGARLMNDFPLIFSKC